jgi:hypothetical protein
MHGRMTACVVMTLCLLQATSPFAAAEAPAAVAKRLAPAAAGRAFARAAGQGADARAVVDALWALLLGYLDALLPGGGALGPSCLSPACGPQKPWNKASPGLWFLLNQDLPLGDHGKCPMWAATSPDKGPRAARG